MCVYIWIYIYRYITPTAGGGGAYRVWGVGPARPVEHDRAPHARGEAFEVFIS